MAGGKHRSLGRVIQQSRKSVLLDAEERRVARDLRAKRFPPLAIARALGRSLPDVEAYLSSPEAAYG